MLKLGDFGLARQQENTLDRTCSHLGTAAYAAPEIESADPSNMYDFKVDIWSLGCIVYEVCTLHYAFYGNEILSGNEQLQRVRYNVRFGPIPSLPTDHKMARVLEK